MRLAPRTMRGAAMRGATAMRGAFVQGEEEHRDMYAGLYKAKGSYLDLRSRQPESMSGPMLKNEQFRIDFVELSVSSRSVLALICI
eukprot:1155167-Pelagomonas_calceolata.AAC.4